jgi:sensor histidine kinase YesM
LKELIHIIKNPYESGLLTFFAGVLSILGIYHFLLYFQQRIRAYLFYSLYVFLVFLAIFRFGGGVLQDIFLKFFVDYQYFLTEVTFVVYLLFAYSFMEMRQNYPKWNKYVMTANLLFLAFAILVQFISYFYGGLQLRVYGYNFFLIYMPILALIAYYPIFIAKNPLKWYLITGSMLLFLGWLAPVLVYQLNLGKENFKLATGFFLLGGIVENLLFSLGLGHKQKLLLKENRESHKKLISQFKENERLRNTIQKRLEANVHDLSKQIESDKIEKLRAQYDKELAELKISSLRSQMNPHFVFNSLNSIKLYIINNEKENAVYYLNKFSKLIRKILDATREKEISLADELETMQLYVSIENIRFRNEIEFTVEQDPGLYLESVKLPSLILQPFLENAIWHGLPLAERKEIRIVIKKISKEQIAINIEDSGIGRERSAVLKEQKLHRKGSFGIKITRERLNIFYRDFSGDYKLEFEDLIAADGSAAGTRVQLVIPLT